MDIIAHPIKLLAIPILISVPLVNYLGVPFYEGFTFDLYRSSFILSLKYGAFGIIFVWFISVLNSLICTRKILTTVKWAIFSAVYLSSPFAYILFYPLLSSDFVNVYDTMGAAIRWFGVGLLITYFWWFILTFSLFCITSLEYRIKADLIWSLPFAPFYYFGLCVICKTVGIFKFISRYILSF